MFFGKASFQAQKGRASAPRKKLIREFATRGVVLMVSEYNTSQKCPGCHSQTTEDSVNRIRSCENVSGCLLRENSDSGKFNMDRDDVGSTNIGIRGTGIVLGLSYF